MKFLCVALLFCHYFIDFGTAQHEKFMRTIHGYEDPPLQKTIIINRYDEEIGANYPSSNRIKRETEPSNKNESTIIQKINYLNDTHKQLMVHWVGEGSNVIICLARDPSSTLLPGVVQSGPSSVYISYDYGDSYEDKSHLFKLPKSDTFATIEKFYNHPKYNNYFVFADVKHNLLFVTSNHGRNITRHELSFKPNEIVFQEYQPSIFVVLDKNDPMQKLYLTEDFGASFTHIQDSVKSFQWLNENSADNRQRLIIQRIEPSGLSTVFYSPATPKPVSTIYATDVNDFYIKGDYFFTTKRNSKQHLELYVSTKLGRRYKCMFDTTLKMKNYLIVDVTSNRALVAVSHSDNTSHLYVSENLEPKSTTSVEFKLSLEDVLAYFPGSTWQNSWLIHVSEDAFADVYKVEGVTGIYIASRLITKPSDSNLGPQHLSSVITFDHGRSWRLIKAPSRDVENQPISCETQNNCSLHLSQKFGQLYPDTRAISILSSKSAPGIIMATGVTGKSLKGHYGIYMSDDAGLTWRQTLREWYFFNMGDHGGILTAVKYFKSRGETRHILYSTNEGETWNEEEFHSENIRLYGLMTEPGENTTVFTMFGSLPDEHRWLIVKIDLIKAFKYKSCSKNDYKTWSPSQMDDDNRNYIPCILGQQVTYERRMPHADCYNGLDYDSPISMTPCGCDILDYECDVGFVRLGQHGHCVRNSSLADPYRIPTTCKSGQFYKRTKGYRKIQGDVCVNGFKNHYEPEEVPCPFKEVPDFLLFAQRERISRFNLVTGRLEEVPVKNLKSVIAIDFDMKTNCVYWADIASDHIGRQCLGTGSQQEILVSSDLASIEGMALDWISNTLYFVDGMRSKIELIRTDINHSGRMRRTILGPNDLKKPRGIALHPKLGYMFWTDWSSDRPSVNRANLDGTKIKKLFGRPQVEWPNGVSIDYIAERIYWVDARQDYIASSDLHGDYFKIIIAHDDVVSHPFAVAVFKNTMYWDDWKRNAIFSADKDNFKGVEVLKNQLPGLMDLKVYAHGLQIGTNACTNSTCPYICVGAAKIGQKTCLCPDGMEMTNGQCMCPGGVAPFTNSTCPKIKNSCAPDHFTCANGFCVPKGWRCDGEDDCGDDSDERQCNSQTCPPSFILCGDGKCLPQYWQCDFDLDCGDGSDELNCPKQNCTSDHFACKNGKCISLKWKCDGENDCRDGSDEINCARPEAHECKFGEFKCKNGGVQCIPQSWRCDNKADCHDNSDEIDCMNNTCSEMHFSCGAPTNQCVSLAYVCDGDKDCPNGRDEQNCTVKTTTSPISTVDQFIPTNGTCQSWMFRCLNKRCIPYWWKCDGTDDCNDGSDELGCDTEFYFTTKTPPTTTTTLADDLIPMKICSNNQFMCSFNGECIFHSWVCDGMQDCPNGEDELNCELFVNCTKNQFKCHIDGSCIPYSAVCNHHFDCPDGTDELSCEHNLPNGPATPSCSSGYFPCDGSSCHPLALMCNGKMDCIDGYDERDCEKTARVYQVLQMGVDERGNNETTLLLYWWIPTQNQVKLEFLPSISRAGDETTWQNQTWTNATEYHFKDLQPFTRYNMTVYVRLANENTVFPPAKYFIANTAEGVPSEPYNVTAKQRNGSHVLISWNKPTHPNGIIRNYQICFTPPTPEIQLKLSGNETAHLLSADFHPNVEYSFYVVAHNRKYESKRSIVAKLLFDGESNLDAVQDLKIVKKDENSVTLSWSYNKTVDGFNVDVITAQPYHYPKMASRQTNTTGITIDGLAPGAYYRFKVHPVKKSFVGQSLTITQQTKGKELPRITQLNAVQNEKFGNGVNLTWSKPIDERKVEWVYGIYYGIDEEELFEKARMETRNLTATIDNLQACEIYTFGIGIVGPIGIGPLSKSSFTLRTIPNDLAPPKHLTVSRDVDNMLKMRIKWSPSCMSESISYIIRVHEITQNHVTFIHYANASELLHVMNVPFGAIYNITVRTDKLNSKWTENVTYHAPPMMPPSGVNTFVQNNGSYIIYWQESQVPPEVGHFKYEVLVSEGNTLKEDIAERFLVEKPPFFYTNRTKNMYTFAVRLITDDGYYSLMSNQVSLLASDLDGTEEITGASLSLILGLSVLFLIACSVIVFVIIKHRRLQNSFQRFANSHYNRRSGSATFDDTNGLDEDDCPQIAGFSDDEPLVVA